MPYIPPEVLQEIKKVDLKTYLKEYEPRELVHFSGDVYTTRTHDSIKISNGKWIWWGTGIGGKSALDYLVKVRGLSFMEAAELMLDQMRIKPLSYVPMQEQEEPKEKMLLLPKAFIEDCDKVGYKELGGGVYALYSDIECTNELARVTTVKGDDVYLGTFPAGMYYLKQIKAPEGYVLKSAPDEYEIYAGRSKNTWIMNTEQTGSLYIYHEGEKLVGWDGTNFVYENRGIGQNAIRLTAAEDIHSANGTLVYSKGDVVKERVEGNRFGSTKVTGLTHGTYAVTELEDLEGYRKNEEAHIVTLEYGNPELTESYRKQEKNKNNKRSLATKIILVVIILFIMSLGFSCALDYHNKKTVEEMEEFITEFEKNMNAITEIEDAMKQEAINTLVEEGMMNVNFSTRATFDGKVSKSFNIKNIENNHESIVFEIFDEDGESIYKSKKIAPGYEMNCIELDKELTKGRHECTIEIRYAVEGHVSTVFPVIVEVM